MQYPPRQHVVKSFSFILCLMLASCEGSPWGTSLEKNLEPDPRLLDEETANSKTASTPDVASTATSSSTSVADEPEATNETESLEAEELATPTFTQASYTDIGEAPEELQQYIEDLVLLDVLMLIDVKADDNVERNPNEFLPNEIITRREYARWLIAVNNHFYSDQRAKKIRPAVESSKPAFQDVGVTNIDFSAIQGLAEAGIIPSSLNGSSTAVKFRPDAPLTRKDLILWKVPLDTRSTLPDATGKAVIEAWGFQDAGKIEPAALKAVLADHGNGEFANIRRALGYTTLFQPEKGVTRAEAAAVLWRFGNSTEGITAAELLASDGDKSDDNKADTTQETNE
ncbi:S-layer homology domain-containing protein [Leptothoe spongobia]|uniref:S-layer homology domain-containing protein n=1 Tax=Leptothoe spongobia TAU-MAC 1115 TaxID=1967444 RepID=A0A947DH08_9CYAN|nr:S-layer homology domain-containing protein [Leptothoe spongobia]MBT9316711.1 S-layer homology domain-containing protein [Leptothoe spongobia TAU-MAC 1115]